MVSITRALEQHLQSEFPGIEKRSRFQVEPDAVDEKLLAIYFDQGQSRDLLKLVGDSRPIVSYVGSLYEGRGIDLIVDLSRKLPEHFFLIAGGRDQEVSRYRQLTAGSDNIRFDGYVDQQLVPHYLAAADVLLMPHANRVTSVSGKDISQFCSPMKMFEYMAAGKPIIASNLPVLKEVLVSDRNALLIDHSALDGWAIALRRLQAEPQLAKSLSLRARQDVANYTWEARAKRILDAHAERMHPHTTRL